MSNSVDNRVVQMGFDHEKFDRGVDQAIEKIDSLNTSLAGLGGASKSASFLEKITSKFNFSNILAGTSEAAKGLTNMQLIGLSALDALTKKAVDLGVSLTQNVANKIIGPMRDGFGEYQTQMGAVQTVLTNTADAGTTINDVNKAFAELNTYADKTIYNFAEMTRNIGTFTAAGVDLEKSTTAIKGIANLAAGSGSNSQQATTAMYQLSQALAAGTVKLQDWNSVVNAGMGGQLFQNELKKTAKQYGIDVDSLIEKNGSFRESLQEGWLTSDVLIDTLNRFADESTDIGKRLTAAATEVKTFGELFDSMGESIGSGWARLWQTIVGDYDEAKKTLTEIFNAFDNVVGGMFDSINNTAAEWKKLGGRTKLIDALRLAIQNAYKIVVTAKDAFASVFPPKTGKDIMNLTTKFYDFVKATTPVKGTLNTITTLITGMANGFKLLGTVFGGAKAFVPVIKNIANYFQTLFVGIANYITYLSNLRVLSDAIMSVWYAFKNVIQSLADVFKDVFPTSILDKLPEVTEIILHNLVKLRELLAENKDRIANIFQAVLNVEKSVLKLFGTIASNVSKNDILPKIITLLAKVGNLIANIINSILENKTIMSIVGGAISFITTVASKLLDVVTSIFDGFDSFKNAISNLFSFKIGERIETVSGNLTKVGDRLKTVGNTTNNLSTICSKLGDVFNGIKDKFIKFKNIVFGEKPVEKVAEDANEANGALSFMGKIAEMITHPITTIMNFIRSIPEKLAGVWDNLKGAFSHINTAVQKLFKSLIGSIRMLKWDDLGKIFSSIFNIVLNRGVHSIFKNISESIGNFGEMFGKFGEAAEKLGKSLSGLFDSLGKAVKNFGKMAAAKAFKEIALGIALLAAALFVLSLVDIESLAPAFAVMTGLIVEVVAIVIILSKSLKAMDIGQAATLAAISAVITALGVSLLLLALSLKIVSTIQTEPLIAASTAIVAILLVLAIVVKALSDSSKVLGPGNALAIFAMGQVITSLAVAILILALSLKLLSNVDGGALALATIVIVALVFSMVLAVKELSKLEKVASGSARTFLALSISVLILALSIKMLSKLDTKALVIGTAAIIILMFVMTEMVKQLVQTKGISKGTAVILAISIGLLLIASAIKKLENVDIAHIAAATLAIVVILAVMMIGLKALSSAKATVMVAGSIAMVIASSVLKSIAESIALLKDLDWKQILAASVAMSLIMLVFSILFNSLDDVKKAISIIPVVSAMGNVITAIGNSLSKLKDMKVDQMIAIGASISAMLLVITLLVKVLSKNTKKIEGAAGQAAIITAIGKAIGDIGTGLSKLANMDTNLLAVAGLVIVAILGIMTVMVESLQKVAKDVKKSIAIAGMIALMGLSVQAIGIAFGNMKDIKVGTLIASAVAIAAILAIFIVLFKVFEKLKPSAVAAAAIGLPLVSLSILSIAKGLSFLADVPIGNIIVGALAISVLLGVLAIMSKKINPMTFLAMGPAMIALGTGLMIMALALAALAVVPFAGIIVAVVAMAVIFGVIFLMCKLMKPMTKTLLKFAYGIATMAIAMFISAAALFLFSLALQTFGASLVPIILQISGALAILSALAPDMAKWATQIMQGVLPELGKQLDMLVQFLLSHLVTLLQELAKTVPDMVAALLDMAERVLKELQDNERTKNIIQYAFNILWQIVEGLLESLIEHTPKLTKDIVEWIATSLESLHHELQTNGDRIARGIADIIGDLLEMAIKAIYHLFERLAQIGTDLGNKIGEGLKKVGPKLKAIFIDPIKNGIQWIKDRFRDLWSLGANIINNIKKGIKHGIDAVYNAIIKPILDGLDKMKELVVKAFEAGKNFIQGFIDGVSEVGKKAVEGITWLGEKVVEGWQVILGEHSPSVIAKRSAVYWIEGFLNGLDKMEGSLKNNVSNIGSIVVSGMEDAVAASKNNIDAGDITYSITPIVDMNSAINDISNIGLALKGLNLDSFNASFAAPAISLSSNEERVFKVNNSDVVDAVTKLTRRLNGIEEHMDNLQVFLDSSTLVGEIKKPLNKEFGKMMIRTRRGKL